MNDSNFETELRRLHPAAPASVLEERIAAELSSPEPKAFAKGSAPGKREPVSIRFEQAREPLLVRCFHSLGWALAGAASAVAVIALHPGKSIAEKSAPVSDVTPAVPTHDTSETDPEPATAASLSSTGAFSPSPSNVVNANHPSSIILHPFPSPSRSIAANLAFASYADNSSEFKSLEVTRELVSTEEGTEVEYRSDNTPMHRVRYHYKEHHAWINPSTGARTEIEIPREDVFLKPVSMQ